MWWRRKHFTALCSIGEETMVQPCIVKSKSKRNWVLTFIAAIVSSRARFTKAYICCTRHIVVGLQWTRPDCVIEGTVMSNCAVLRYGTPRKADLSTRANLTLYLRSGSRVWDHQAWLALQRLYGPSWTVKANRAFPTNGHIRTIWGWCGTCSVTQKSCWTIISHHTTLAIMTRNTWSALVDIAQSSVIAVGKCSIRADHRSVCSIRTVMIGRTYQWIRGVCKTVITLRAIITWHLLLTTLIRPWGTT